MRFLCKLFTSLGVQVGWWSRQWLGAHVVFSAAQAVHLAGSFGVDAMEVCLVTIVALAPVVRSVAMILARSSSILALGTFLIS